MCYSREMERRTAYTALILCITPIPVWSASLAHDGWEPGSPRKEISPAFRYDPKAGRNRSGAFIIEADAREGLNGYWAKSFPVAGGKYYKLDAWRRLTGAQWPHQSGVVDIRWTDSNRKPVLDDRRLVENYLKGFTPWVPLDYASDGRPDADGWSRVSAVHQAPTTATMAEVRLHLRWAANARAEWSDVSFAETNAPGPRKVRLAAVHFRPSGGTPQKNREQFEPLIREAARQKADLIVLPETLTYYRTGIPMADIAEPIPGPSTEYFGALAREFNVYIVAGLLERDGHVVYNTAALLGPDGKLAGKYRKVTLPDGEIEEGVTPGRDYPVFQTRFGTLGMMICYDGFFPEVARELTKRGAEVIAWPVWGCNPDLARARAAENHTYLVSSTYEDISRNWMLSAVWDHTGRTIGLAKDWGSIAIAEVDLNARTRWPSLGDFRSKIPHHVPMVASAPSFE
jgi:predicted amidohydrolase